MSRVTKTLTLLVVAVLLAGGGYFAFQKFSEPVPAPLHLGAWRAHQLAGLRFDAPCEFQKSPLNLGAVQEFVENGELHGFKAEGFEITVLRTTYKPGVELNFDNAAQSAVDGFAQLDGVRDFQQTSSELTVSGKTARRISATSTRWRKTARLEMLLIADGQTYSQVQVLSYGTGGDAAAAADRLLKSVSLAP